ncbi:hypothetical protein ACFQ88_07760 [Paenibacillus sp. NPDC056579]|uniref:hypothetical protein n=1 Tax=Paenibacillus sp. NPDC056579 TaxID=3345871 RepID=UPI0036C531A2
MMKLFLRGPVLILIIAALALTACNKGNSANTGNPADAKPNDAAAMTATTLQGDSPHWRVKLNYTPKGNNKFQEVVVIENKLDENLEEVTVTIVRKNGETQKNDLAEPSVMKPGASFTLQNINEVASWKDTDQVQVEWKADGRRTKEYLTVDNKTAAAPAK